MKSATCVVVVRDGLVLAVSRRNDTTRWGLPGGKVDPGEGNLEGALREAHEELGLQFDPKTLEPVYSDVCRGQGPDDTYWVTTYFVTEQGPALSDVHAEAGLVARYVLLTELCVRDTSPFADYNLGVAKAMAKLGVALRAQ